MRGVLYLTTFLPKQALGPKYDQASFKQGCDMPDSFYFVNFSEFPNCQIPDDYFHNIVTAGYLWQYANSAAGQQFVTADFDPASLAYGFASHVVADLIGFHSDGGYLGDTVPSYVTEFPFMTSIDAYCLSQDNTIVQESYPWATQEAAAFIANFSSYMNTQQSNFPIFNTSQVEVCILPWSDTIVNLQSMANFQVKTQFVQQSLVFFDKLNATTYQQAVDNFNASLGCVVSAITYYAQSISNPQNTPENVKDMIVSYAAGLFNAGKCTAGSSSFLPILKKN